VFVLKFVNDGRLPNINNFLGSHFALFGFQEQVSSRLCISGSSRTPLILDDFYSL